MTVIVDCIGCETKVTDRPKCIISIEKRQGTTPYCSGCFRVYDMAGNLITRMNNGRLEVAYFDPIKGQTSFIGPDQSRPKKVFTH